MTLATSSRPLVSVVVVNYNGMRHLPTCFKSLLETQYPCERLEVILVDNGSTDGSLALMAAQFPGVVVLRTERNNYCTANNLGIARARGIYVALLNNDTRVDPGWLEPLIEVLERCQEVAAAGSKVLSMDGARLISIGHAELPNYYWADRGYNQPDQGQYDQITEVSSLTNAAVVYRRAALDQVGLLDEDFVMFVEDVDLGYRCRAQGWRLVAVPQSRVHHVMHGTLTEEDARRWWERNRLVFVAKHHPEHLTVAWHGQGYYRPDSPQHADGRGAETLAAVVAKLIHEHGLARAKPILPALFQSLDQAMNIGIHEWVQRWDAASAEAAQHLARVQALSEELAAQSRKAVEQRAALETRLAAVTQNAAAQRAALETQLAAVTTAQTEERIAWEAKLAAASQEAAAQRAVIEGRLNAVSEEAEEQRRRWQAQQAAWREQLEATRASIEERDLALAAGARRSAQLEWHVREAQARETSLQQEVASIDQAVRRLLVVKAQRAPLSDLETWLRDFRQRCPKARIGLFAHLVPDEYERVASSDLVDDFWLFSPGRRPFTFWSLARILPRLWWRRYDLAVIPQGDLEGYHGFRRAWRLAGLSGARRRRALPSLCQRDVTLSEAVSQSSTVKAGEPTTYLIGVTNPGSQPQQIRLQMSWTRLMEHPHQENELSRLATTLGVTPRSTRSVTVQYDWVGHGAVVSDGEHLPLDEYHQVAPPETTVYRVRVSLTDLDGRMLRSCDLFQRVVETA